MEPILIGVTDRTILVFVPDPASGTGTGKTGLVAASLTVSFTRVETDNDVVVTDVTSSLNDLASLTAAHNDWGWFPVSATLAPGLYRLDLADALFASGAWYAVVQVQITSGLAAVTPKAFQLVAYNPLDAAALGLTNLNATISSRATPAEVNAEVLDVMNVDTFAEPTGVPPATDTLANKIGRQHMVLRNGFTIDATDKRFKDDGGADEWRKPLADDGTTYTESESTTP